MTTIAMQVVAAHNSLLSNYEVLKHLKEHNVVHALVKKEDTDVKLHSASATVTYNQNVRTIEFEAIAHLTTPPLSTIEQDKDSIVKLLKQLGAYNLTKPEKLQIVNLLPSSLVELYVIVEDLEDRFSEDDMLRIIQIVASTKTTPTFGNTGALDAKLDEVMNLESGIGQPGDIKLDRWIDEASEGMLIDEPVYGEDDLAGDEDGHEDS